MMGNVGSAGLCMEMGGFTPGVVLLGSLKGKSQLFS